MSNQSRIFRRRIKAIEQAELKYRLLLYDYRAIWLFWILTVIALAVVTSK